MLSVHYGFETNLKRSGHASCWCPPLQGVVQFGGWPPSDQLSRVIHEEGSCCPLYVMPLTRLTAAIAKADRRKAGTAWDECMRETRVCRLARVTSTLEGHEDSGQVSHDIATCPLCVREVRGKGLPSRPRKTFQHAAPPERPGTTAASLPRTHGVMSDQSDQTSETSHATAPDFVYAAGYHSEAYSQTSSRTSSARSVSSYTSSERAAPSDTQPRSRRALAASVGRRTRLDRARERSDASYAPPTLTRALLQQLDQHDTENVSLRARLEEMTEEAGEPARDTTEARSNASRHFGAAGSSLSHTQTHRSTRTAFMLRERTRHDEVTPLLQDAEEIAGKRTVAPLRWRTIRPPVAPRTRHGHTLVYCADQLFLIGGSYWAHGNALASTDMTFHLKRRTWSQTNSLLPPRFCAAVAVSNARPPPSLPSPRHSGTSATLEAPTPFTSPAVDSTSQTPHSDGSQSPITDARWRVDPDAIVVYAFGGLNYSRALTNSLHRLWLPEGTLEELPQYGAQPRNQFKGVLVCDVQVERSPAERRAGCTAVGRLFYMDGFQEGRPMAPALRSYNVANGVWTRLCPSPDLTRSQLSLAQYTTRTPCTATTAAPHVGSSTQPRGGALACHAETQEAHVRTYLSRFEVLGGMPTRRGRQLRSRTEYSFDVGWGSFDFEHALPVLGLTAHTITVLPDVSPCGPPRRADSGADAHTGGATTGMSLRNKGRSPHRTAFAEYVQHLCAKRDSEESIPVHQGNTAVAAAAATAAAARTTQLLEELVCQRQVVALCVGGNEDQKSGDQNNLGEPVGWIYCLGPRRVPLSEFLRVTLDKQRVPYRTLLLQGDQKDDLLDELF